MVAALVAVDQHLSPADLGGGDELGRPQLAAQLVRPGERGATRAAATPQA